MIKALIFDFDGLILDTELPIYQSWQEVYHDYQQELAMEQWALCIGGTLAHFDPYADLAQKMGYALPREELRLRTSERHMKLIETMKALPGVEQYLQDAQRSGLKIGLASNSSRDWVEGHLTRLNLLSYFESLSTGDRVAHSKPAPDLYLAALKALEIRAEEAIALEDSPHGVRAAQAAGIFCVAVPNQLTKLLSLDHADMQLTAMADLPLSDLLVEVEAKRKAVQS